jgi:protein-tyrosine kinase
MSRIHEALKKAEQERAAQGGPAQPDYQPGFSATAAAELPVMPRSETPPAENRPAEVGARVPANGGAASTAAMPSFGSPFSLDVLLARCVPQSWVPDEKTMLFFNGDDIARGSEEFRTLRSRLYHAREKMPLKKLLITSALPKEGKSFTASNLAQVLVRQHGRRVLLIDADLRGPRLHMMLGTTSSPGLADYLQGGSDEFSIMQRGPMENLFFIPSGQEISDPAELVANGRLKLLLQRVEALFDWIIVDSPPAVPVSDASVLAKACDGVLMVVRSNATPVEMARRARQEFPEAMLVGVVLNGTSMDAMPYTRYYYDAYPKSTTESKTPGK